MFPITKTMVAKIVAKLIMDGRIEAASDAMAFGMELAAIGMTFESSTAAADFVSCELWNSGLVT